MDKDRQQPVLGILAGGGPLPGKVAEAAKKKGYSIFIVAFKDFAEPHIVSSWPHEYVRLAAAGHILNILRQNNCKELVLIGPVKRPSFFDLRPDPEGVRILGKIGKALFAGDDGLLASLVRVLNEEGFTVRGAHEFLQPVYEGILGDVIPDKLALQDIAKGIKINKVIGELDIGQACIVQNELVIAVEAMEGTDAMLKRAKDCQQPGLGGILIKQVKPNQERKADMPTIGPKTVYNAHYSGLRGIAFEAEGTLLIHKDEMVAIANQKGLFLLSYNPVTFEQKYLRKEN